jgi:hypothetical protein
MEHGGTRQQRNDAGVGRRPLLIIRISRNVTVPEISRMLFSTRSAACIDSEDKLMGVRFSWKKRGTKTHAGWDNTLLGWIEIANAIDWSESAGDLAGGRTSDRFLA